MSSREPKIFLADVGRYAHTPCYRYVFAYGPKQVARHYGMHESLAGERVIELAYLPVEIDENLCDGHSYAQLMRHFSNINSEGRTYADEGADDITGKGEAAQAK
jgi:hypothetical protein